MQKFTPAFLGKTVSVFFLFLFISFSLNAATFTVTKTADTDDGSCDGDCSLREAIAEANAAATDDVIEFSALFNSPQTIVLDSALGGLILLNNGTITINGPGTDLLNVSGNNDVRVFFNQALSNATLRNLTVRDGLAPSSFPVGGGIWNNNQFNNVMLLESVVVTDNSATQGGGINHGGGILIIRNSTISGNTATATNAGGGIATTSSDSLLIVNSTISGNTGTGFTGANNAPSRLINSTVSDNSSFGINTFDGAVTTLRNSIVANSQGSDCNVGGAGSTINAEFSLIESGLGCVNGTNISNLTGDPKLGPLQNNGGPTQTHALLCGSPAYNTGQTDSLTDQRGQPRGAFGADDIGAFESQTALNSVTVALCQDTTIYIDASGFAVIDSTFINNSSNATCGLDSMAVSKNSFSCSDIGVNPVRLYVYDVNGNVDSCTATVTVVDTVPHLAPTVTDASVCRNQTLIAGQGLMATCRSAAPNDTIYFEDFDSGSSGWTLANSTDNETNCVDGAALNSLKLKVKGARTAVSPGISVTNFYASYQLRFDYWTPNNGQCPAAINCERPDGGDEMQVQFSTTGSTGPWTTLLVPAYTGGGKSSLTIDLPCISAPTTFYFRFFQPNNGPVNMGGACGGNLGVDNHLVDNIVVGEINTLPNACTMASPPTIKWYTASSGGTPVASGPSSHIFDPTSLNPGDPGYVDASVTGVTPFYASCSFGDCESPRAVANFEVLPSPVAVCQDITVYLDSNAQASIVPSDIDNDTSGLCPVDTFTLSRYDFVLADTTAPVSVTLSAITGTDTSTCTANVTVLDTFVRQEIAVSGNAIDIANGETNVSPANNTDFDSTGLAEPVVRDFVIQNLGEFDLDISDIDLIAVSGEFEILSATSGIVPGNGSLLLQIQFNPQSVGTFSATVSIASNDVDENPFTFTIEGKGFVNNGGCAPVVVVPFAPKVSPLCP